jgi:uncharacterized membrane protein YccC
MYKIHQTAYQIGYPKQQIEEAADPQEKRRLQHPLKELQILQLWQLSQREANPMDEIEAMLAKLKAEFANDDGLQLAQLRADQVKTFLDADDLEGLRPVGRRGT